MGTVYRCRDEDAGVDRAVKELVPPSGTAALERVAQFNDEGRLLSTLSHPHLPRVFDFFEENERFYLVMELVDGQTMRQWVQTNGRPPQALAIRWLDRMLDVLSYLHGCKPPIIFRDVSPDNVMVNDTDVKLIDFGLARLFVPDTRTRPALRGWGSPNFAAPEHYTQSGTLPASDLYGVAATAYWLFLDEPPPEAVQRLIHNERRLTALQKAVRRPLYEWVKKGMALEVDRRFSNAADMRMELMRAAFAQTPPSDEVAGPAMWTFFQDSLRSRLRRLGWTIESRVAEPFSLVASRRVDLRMFYGFCWLADPLTEETVHQAAVLSRQHALRRKGLLPAILYFTVCGNQVPDPAAVAMAAEASSNPSAGLRAIILLPVDLARGLAYDAHVPSNCRDTNDRADFILNVRIAVGGGTAQL